MEKVVLKDLGLNFDGMPEAQRGFMEKCAQMVCDIVNKSNEGVITSTEMATQLKEAIKPFSNVDNESFKSLSEDYTKALETIKSLGEEIEKLKQKGINPENLVAKFDENFDEMYDSEKFQAFVNDHGPAAKGFVFKDMSLTDNYTGNSHVLRTQQTDILVTDSRDKKDHIRNHITFLASDPTKDYVAYAEYYDVDRNARYVAENGMLPESSFKMREKTADLKRLGTHYRLSKRMLKNRAFVRSIVLTKIVEAVLNAEDYGFLRGDGNGDNIKGIFLYDGVRAVEDIINDNIVTINAGGVESLEQVANGVVVTIAKPYDLLMDGLKLDVSGATKNTELNATFDVIKLNDTQLLLEGLTLTEATATPDNLKADAGTLVLKAKNGLYKSIESPNSIDAISAAVAVMTYAEFTPTLLMLNPSTICAIESEKATDGNRLEVVRDFAGNMRIGGMTVVPCKEVPEGRYFLGDMTTGFFAVEYTPLMLEWCDDVETKLKNQVVLYAQEEIITAVTQAHAFAYGKISSLKAALKKA